MAVGKADAYEQGAVPSAEAAIAAGGRITAQRTGYCTGRAYDLRP